MKSAKVEELSAEKFLPFGSFAKLVDPETEVIGAPPVQFFRDEVQQETGLVGSISFSTCRVEKRDYVITTSEYHSSCGEGILPLDNDVLIHVAPATGGPSPVPVEKMRVFRVPKGTMVTLRPGVWHHAPWTANSRPASVLIVLPERTYANDCVVITHAEAEQIKIEM